MYEIVIVLAISLGKYIGKIFLHEKNWPDKILNPIDKIFYKLGGINPDRQMTWKRHLVTFLTINLVWFLIAMFVLTNMSWLPLNPDHNASMSADLAFNTAVSFVTNTNLQITPGNRISIRWISGLPPGNTGPNQLIISVYPWPTQ